MPGNSIFLSIQGHCISGCSLHELLLYGICKVASLHDSHHRLTCQTGTRSGTRTLCCNRSFMRLFCVCHLLYAAFGAIATTKVQWIAKNHFSCCSQLSLLLFESFYCFPIFSILALSLLSLLAKSHLIQILSLVHLCYYLLYPSYVMYTPISTSSSLKHKYLMPS